MVTSLKGEISALEVTYEEEVIHQRGKREELIRRLTEHASELHSAAMDAIVQIRVYFRSALVSFVPGVIGFWFTILF